jgi:hypothetical protein
VPSRNEPLDALLAIATDLLAQTEAQQRTAIRLEQSARELSRNTRDRAGAAPPIGLLREQLRAMRDLFEAERALLDELERELTGASN